MNCKNCNYTLPENGVLFCPKCGVRVEQQEMFVCKACGKSADAQDRFCAFCGGEIKLAAEKENSMERNGEAKGKGRVGKSYIFTVLSAIITFLIRVSAQTEQKLYISSFNFHWAIGLDPGLKPFCSLIPVVAGIIAAIIVSSDKNTPNQKKVTVLLVNAIFLVLSFVFIWFDLPRDLFDF